jgi:hypothetical protein
MDTQIGVGLIIGLVSASSFYVYNSDRFSVVQKVFLLVGILFPPAQWIGILGVLVYNYFKDKKSLERLNYIEINKSSSANKIHLKHLSDLKNNGILSDEEYWNKISDIDSKNADQEIKLTDDYKKLKSLFDSNVLSEIEFNDKVILLKGRLRSNKQPNRIPEQEELQDFRVTEELSEGYFVIIDDKLNYGFADKDLNKVIDTIYEIAFSFSEGLALVRSQNKFGFINKANEIIVPIHFDEATSFNDGFAKVKKEHLHFKIDKHGNKYSV